jgi:hypothetical protein
VARVWHVLCCEAELHLQQKGHQQVHWPPGLLLLHQLLLEMAQVILHEVLPASAVWFQVDWMLLLQLLS